MCLCDDDDDDDEGAAPVSVDRMDITKGSLDDISRPASGEIRRPSPDVPRCLEVLSPDVTHTQVEKLLYQVC